MRPRLLLIAALCLLLPPAHAQLNVGTDGFDGSDLAFSPSANVTVNLADAATNTWTAAPTTKGRGIYDVAKWAVVYKYASVNIPEGVIVNFANHPSGAPVVWLVQGNATINGVIDLNGQHGNRDVHPLPGPGGFRGGVGAIPNTRPGSAGFGPGGGGQTDRPPSGGSYATKGSGDQPGLTYGNDLLLPLIGGSGGTGRPDVPHHSGGAGGGAILIVVKGTLTINGQILANGGDSADWGGAGSGGGIRLAANVLAGTGRLSAVGGTYNFVGGEGRIRLEAMTYSGTFVTFPQTLPVKPTGQVMIWPPPFGPHGTGEIGRRERRHRRSLGQPLRKPRRFPQRHGPGPGRPRSEERAADGVHRHPPYHPQIRESVRRDGHPQAGGHAGPFGMDRPGEPAARLLRDPGGR